MPVHTKPKRLREVSNSPQTVSRINSSSVRLSKELHHNKVPITPQPKANPQTITKPNEKDINTVLENLEHQSKRMESFLGNFCYLMVKENQELRELLQSQKKQFKKLSRTLGALMCEAVDDSVDEDSLPIENIENPEKNQHSEKSNGLGNGIPVGNSKATGKKKPTGNGTPTKKKSPIENNKPTDHVPEADESTDSGILGNGLEMSVVPVEQGEPKTPRILTTSAILNYRPATQDTPTRDGEGSVESPKDSMEKNKSIPLNCPSLLFLLELWFHGFDDQLSILEREKRFGIEWRRKSSTNYKFYEIKSAVKYFERLSEKYRNNPDLQLSIFQWAIIADEVRNDMRVSVFTFSRFFRGAKERTVASRIEEYARQHLDLMK